MLSTDLETQGTDAEEIVVSVSGLILLTFPLKSGRATGGLIVGRHRVCFSAESAGCEGGSCQTDVAKSLVHGVVRFLYSYRITHHPVKGNG